MSQDAEERLQSLSDAPKVVDLKDEAILGGS